MNRMQSCGNLDNCRERLRARASVGNVEVGP